jgi:uncharacterized protein (TIGR03437 family)
MPLQTAGVLNAASLLPGPVAPGEAIGVVGSAPADAGLSFDGAPAQILSAPPNRIEAIVPAPLSGTMTQLQVTSQVQTVANLVLPVAPAAPAIFTADGGGSGQGAILNEDLTFNSACNPAARGSIITLLATGVGPAQDALSVQVGGIDCQVLYTEPPDVFNPGVLRV